MGSKEEYVERLIDSFRLLRSAKWDKVSESEIKHSEVIVLFCIAKNFDVSKDKIKITDISTNMKLSPSTITPLLNSLEEKGYILRTLDKEDRRVVYVSVTESGSKIVEEHHEKMYKIIEELYDFLGYEKAMQLADLVPQVAEFFEKKKKEMNSKEEKNSD